MQQGVANVKESHPKLDLPAFLTDLQQVFNDASFNEKSVGWTPAVQEAISSIYEELLKSVDLSTVQAKVVQSIVKPLVVENDEAVNSPIVENDIAGKPLVAEGKDVDGKPLVVAQEEIGKQSLVVEQNGVRKTLTGKIGDLNKSVDDEVQNNIAKDLHGLSEDADAEDMAKVVAVDDEGYVGEVVKAGQQNSQTATFDSSSHSQGNDGHGVSGVGSRIDSTHHTLGQQHSAGAAPAQPKLPPALAQQTFQNISNTVLNGLKNNEHHLVLRLYPQQLGEVKVEMMVRDHNVSLSFGMENSRVKETLESNMQQFQDNLAKQGFTLQGCQVSVGQQQEDPNAAWQFFEQARQQGQGKSGRDSLADVPLDSMYIRPIHDTGREGGISLFI